MLRLRFNVIRASLALAATVLIALAPAVSVHAAANPSGTGQPNASCQSVTTVPGQSDMAPGSAFNPDGKAGTVYAGQQAVNSNNPKSVSQYDIACIQQP